MKERDGRWHPMWENLLALDFAFSYDDVSIDLRRSDISAVLCYPNNSAAS
jgi:hypothetical protein